MIRYTENRPEVPAGIDSLNSYLAPGVYLVTILLLAVLLLTSCNVGLGSPQPYDRTQVTVQHDDSVSPDVDALRAQLKLIAQEASGRLTKFDQTVINVYFGGEPGADGTYGVTRTSEVTETTSGKTTLLIEVEVYTDGDLHMTDTIRPFLEILNHTPLSEEELRQVVVLIVTVNEFSHIGQCSTLVIQDNDLANLCSNGYSIAASIKASGYDYSTYRAYMERYIGTLLDGEDHVTYDRMLSYQHSTIYGGAEESLLNMTMFSIPLHWGNADRNHSVLFTKKELLMHLILSPSEYEALIGVEALFN
jgi:hypothetical protein